MASGDPWRGQSQVSGGGTFNGDTTSGFDDDSTTFQINGGYQFNETWVDKVWMMFKVSGTQSAPLYGLAPTNRRVELPEIGIMTIVEGKWKQACYFGDELGMMLQFDALHMLQT